MYINENNRVGMELDAQFIAVRVVWEGGGNKENRKMFSHREDGFPIPWGQVKDKDRPRKKAIIWRIVCGDSV